MNNLRNLILCLCLILLTFGTLQANEPLVNSSKTGSPSVKNDSPDVVGIVKSFFKLIFRGKQKIPCCPPPKIVTVNLSTPEIKKDNALIEVSVDTEGFVDSDTLLYKYQVSVGRILGEGAKVIWDLSTAEVGTHSITVEVDDGCGCIKPVTKTVKVIEAINNPIPPGFTFSDGPMSVGITSSIRRTRRETLPNRIPVIKNFSLSKMELVANCLTETSKAENALTVDISVDAEDPDNDTLLYKYAVTAGKIVGDGSKVVWDLSDVKPGKYQVAFEVDDGCGCVPVVTKEITIIENSDCMKENK